MVVTFNVTTPALAGSRWLETTRAQFGESVARLSTGLRVYSAAEDAAGLSIGTKMHAQAIGWQRAQKNVQDGLSAGNVAEGALSQLNDVVARIRELAIQAANGVYTDRDRQLIQDEISVLRGQIRDTVESTQFNGVYLLKGQEFTPPATVDVDGTLDGTVTFDGVTLEAGLGGGSALPTVLSAIPGSGLATGETKSGTYNVQVLSPAERAVLVGVNPVVGPLPDDVQLILSGSQGSATLTFAAGTTSANWVADINALDAGATPVGVVASVEDYYGTGDQMLVLRSSGAGASNVLRAYAIAAGGLTAAPENYLGFDPNQVTDAGTDAAITVDGVLANVYTSSTSMRIAVTDPGSDVDGLSFLLDNTPGGLDTLYTDDSPPGPAFPRDVGWLNVQGFDTQILDLELDIQWGSNQGDQQELAISPMTIGAVSVTDPTDTTTLGGIDVSTQTGALAAIDVADAATQQIARARSGLAASVGALERALEFGAWDEEQVTTSRSRIMDADFARETTEMVQSQLRTETTAAAQAHQNANAAQLLQLVTSSEFAIPSGIPQQEVGGGSGAPAGFTTGSGTPAGFATGSGTPAGFATGSGAPAGFATGSGAPSMGPVMGSGGFAPSAVLPSGFQPAPVIGTPGGGFGGGLSAGQMMNMIAGSLV